MAAAAATGSTLQNVTDNQKRWLVFGIALNKVLVTLIRSFVEQEVQKEYGNLQASHSIHTQSTSGRLKNWPTCLKYENINGNDVFPRLGGGRYDYSKFDCRVTSHVDFAKLYVENHMAKFNAFDEHCDASAVLALLGKVPVFSLAVQSAANDVRQARNAWAHCVFSDWDPLSFPKRFAEMEKLVKSLGLLCANEMYLVNELKDWETKGSTLCMNATIDPDLQKTVQQDLYELKNDVDQMAFEEEVSREKIKKAIHDSQLVLEELREKVVKVEQEQEVIKQDQSSLCDKVNTTQDQMSELKSEHEDMQRRVTSLEDQQNSNRPQISHEIASCESDITFLAARHDADTRQWLLKDFNKWFSDPADSRAYVLLGDPGVGKSVIAGVLAQRSKKAGNLGAAYFCRHNDSTRNDPRCLLGTIASQLCECCSEYNSIMGGEGGIRNLLGSSNLGVQELFTKLLQEPLGRCNSTFCHQRKLAVVDALDETQYESREDFLDLIMNRFPLLPNWLVFFITSRPENTVQLTLKKYNPCVRICSGNVEHDNFYQQHERDIKLFLRNSVDFSRLPISVDDLATKCNGSFLYAFYIVKDLNSPMQSGKSSQLVDLFPGDFDNFLRKNFKRVFEKVGCSLFKKLFGCAISAPSPLPVSFISYVLQREKLKIPKQHVLDALSLFMVLSKTFTFLHSLIPAWLTDEDKARELFIDWNIEANYLKDVIHEILFGFIREQVIEPDLLDYVLRVGIRFLSGFPGKDSSETVFSCLTSFKYIQNRIQSRRIEIYSVIEDFRLAATCQFSHEDRRKEILLKVCMALERNIFILLECPYLLHSCLQNASKVVQDNVVIPDGLSSTWLECNSLVLPSKRPDRHDQSNYALSPDGKVLAYINRQEKNIVFLDSCSLDMIFNLEFKGTLLSNHLEFSPDGKFLFLGRFDRWFSLEKRNVEDFPQFSGLNTSYEWGSFTLDKRWIVVKPYSFLFESSYSCCWLCLLNYLCLWAAKEIVEGQESETVCGCFPDRLLVQIRPSAGEDQDSSVPAMKILLNILRRTHHNEWCSLLEKLQLSYPFEARCRYCPSRMRCETPTLTDMRNFVICHYTDVFKYQVWDVHTGRSALEQAFSSGVQLSPFTYLCHLGTALEKYGVLFSGIDKALSFCNIALLSAVCHHLFFFEWFRRTFVWEEFAVSEKFSVMNSLTALNSVFKQFDETKADSEEQQCELLDELNRFIRRKHLNIRLELLAESNFLSKMRLRLEIRMVHDQTQVFEVPQEQSFRTVRQRLLLEMLEVLEVSSNPLELLEMLKQGEVHDQMQVFEVPQEQLFRKVFKRLLLEQLLRSARLDFHGHCSQLEEIEQYEKFFGLEHLSVSEVLVKLDVPAPAQVFEVPQRQLFRTLLQWLLPEPLVRSAGLDFHGDCSQLEEMELYEKVFGLEHLPVSDGFVMLHVRTPAQVYKVPQEQPHRRVRDRREEREHVQQLKLLERLEWFTQFERLGQREQLEEIEQFEKIVSSRLFRTLVERGPPVLSKVYKMLLFPWRELHQSWPKRFPQFKQLVHLSWYHLESNEKFKFVEAFHCGTDTFTNSPLELQNLPDIKQKGLFTSILPCVSPDGKWIAIRLEGDETTVQLYRGKLQRQHHPYWTNPVYVLKGVKHFAFTNDCVFFLYLTILRSLHTLSLVTGSILTSVSGVRPLRSTPEKQAGYCFQDDDEETNIFVKDFPTVFLSSFLPVVRAEPMQVAFASADAILVLYSDCKLALILNDGTAIASETSLVHPFGGSQQVRKVQFSPDGKLVVTHQGTNILLYSTVPVSDEASTEHGKCLHSVFETKDDFNVQHFTFSADSALLLFCIRRNIGLSFFVWNVHKKVLSASFDPPGLLFGDCCCCFSLDSKELIICTEYYIDFWDHSSRPCRLLRRVKNDVPYNEIDKFTHCAVSPENDLLAYCITDRILLCPLKTSTNQSIRQLPRAHLGKVEFCQFLRGSRYLISYGVDGAVFLWDLSEWKVASFAKIVQRRESIVSMAVSAEGDRVVCVTSFGRLNIIKPFGLKDAMLSKSPLPKEMGSEMMNEAFGGQSREPTAAVHNLQQHLYFSRVSRSDNTEDFDSAELIEEMDFMLHSDDSEGSNEPDELLD